MKKHTVKILHSIEVVIVLFAISIFILANPKTLNYLSSTVSKTYGLHYKSISGNILTNIHITDISYHDKIIAKEADINFNLLKLLLLQLDIEKIKFSKVDMESLKNFINSFDTNSSKKSTTKSSLPIILNIHNIILNILPYNKDKVQIQKLKIDIKKFYLGSTIEVKDVNVDIKSNYFNLNYNGSYDNHFLFINDLNITQLDIEKILLLKDMIKKDSESNSSIIKSVDIKNTYLDTKPFKKGKYHINLLKIKLKDLSSKDMKIYNAKDINLTAKTNIWSLNSTGYIKDSLFKAKVKVSLDDKYFKRFVPFFNFNSLNPIDVKLKINKDKLIGDVNASSKKILTKKLDENLKVKIKSLKTHAEFDFKNLYLHFVSKADIDTKYSKDIKFVGDFYYAPKKSFSYDGRVRVANLENLDKRVSKLFENSLITFKGDKKGLTADLKNSFLTGSYLSKNGYINPKIVINSKEFSVKEIDNNLSKRLDDLKLNFTVKSKLNYKDIKNTKINYEIRSNLVDVLGDYYPNKQRSDFVLNSVKDSILTKIDKKLKSDKLFPINCLFTHKNKTIKLNAFNHDINLTSIFNKDINTSIMIDDTKIDILQQDDKIKYTLHTLSLKDFIAKIQNYYKIPNISADGELDLYGDYNNNTSNIHIDSKWFLYEYAKYKYFFTENTSLNAFLSKNILTITDFDSSGYILEKYRKLFFTKSSVITFDENSTKLDIILNDAISINGYIADTTSLSISSDYYHLNEPEADLFLNFRLNFFSSNSTSSLKGKITLLKGTIKYKPKNSHEVNDEDIVFINKQKTKNTNSKNFNININIMSKKNLKYILGKNKIIFSNDITLFKEKKDRLYVYGFVKVIDGTYYSDDKRFELGSGEILFTGELLNPYLNLKAYYNKDPYNITILIGGKLDSPILNFTSTPYLTQNDILSILLFNTKASSLTNSTSNSNPALSLFGSSFAKGVANSLGVKLDRIELSTTKDGNIGFELEKKINNKVTIIYQNDLVQTIKIRYKNSHNIETNLIFSPESSGIDIIYKNEK